MIPKFRAWDKIDKEMYLVDEINFNRGEFESIGDGITFLRGADEVELMQSTGLHDKNGQEIFEGDIFGTKKDGLLNGIIEYREDLGMWTNSLIRYNNFERLCNVASSREVIGNVYENPELLEADHDRD
ncbi:YopX family protein [Streptococcus gordonii]|uniref:YopX family protein n=1 Tax=Streptococcus gordonii TaxID=1302 RepID=UPI002000F0D3|nr:YopX family protein [Streptococcus gordonii]